jgi:hypothetical protein
VIRWLLVLAALLLPQPARAYWDYGHETISRIGYANVTPRTRARIDALLRQQRLLETPTCPAGTISQASVWADCIKELGPRFSYAGSWHYQNVNVCQPFDLKAACKDGHCVSAQIERQVKLLADQSVPTREKVQALAFLVHFVGDLHQPLHAGDRDDLGGNRMKAAYGAHAPERLNLHAVWDGFLAERAISAPPMLVRAYPAGERARLAAGGVEDWSRESWAVSRDAVYGTATGGDPCAPAPARTSIGEAEVAKLTPVIRDLAVKGGLRLARLLDEALS